VIPAVIDIGTNTVSLLVVDDQLKRCIQSGARHSSFANSCASIDRPATI